MKRPDRSSDAPDAWCIDITAPAPGAPVAAPPSAEPGARSPAENVLTHSQPWDTLPDAEDGPPQRRVSSTRPNVRRVLKLSPQNGSGCDLQVQRGALHTRADELLETSNEDGRGCHILTMSPLKRTPTPNRITWSASATPGSVDGCKWDVTPTPGRLTANATPSRDKNRSDDTPTSGHVASNNEGNQTHDVAGVGSAVAPSAPKPRWDQTPAGSGTPKVTSGAAPTLGMMTPGATPVRIIDAQTPGLSNVRRIGLVGSNALTPEQTQQQARWQMEIEERKLSPLTMMSATKDGIQDRRNKTDSFSSVIAAGVKALLQASPGSADRYAAGRSQRARRTLDFEHDEAHGIGTPQVLHRRRYSSRTTTPRISSRCGLSRKYGQCSARRSVPRSPAGPRGPISRRSPRMTPTPRQTSRKQHLRLSPPMSTPRQTPRKHKHRSRCFSRSTRQDEAQTSTICTPRKLFACADADERSPCFECKIFTFRCKRLLSVLWVLVVLLNLLNLFFFIPVGFLGREQQRPAPMLAKDHSADQGYVLLFHEPGAQPQNARLFPDMPSRNKSTLADEPDAYPCLRRSGCVGESLRMRETADLCELRYQSGAPVKDNVESALLVGASVCSVTSVACA